MASPPLRYFTNELRRAREAAGFSQAQVAKEINFAQSTVAMVETCQRVPQLDFVRALDNALGTDGRFERMLSDLLLSAGVSPDWFRPWLDHEREATVLRDYAPMFVPGLLQTEAYAYAILHDTDKAAARLARQKILAADHPPELIVLVDEPVLHRQVGTPAVMAEQLRHLAGTDQATVRVVPYAAGVYAEGGFVLAVVAGHEYVYVDTAGRGFVLDDAETISEIRHRWDALRGESLPRRQSLDVISRAAEAWRSEA